MRRGCGRSADGERAQIVSFIVLSRENEALRTAVTETAREQFAAESARPLEIIMSFLLVDAVADSLRVPLMQEPVVQPVPESERMNAVDARLSAT